MIVAWVNQDIAEATGIAGVADSVGGGGVADTMADFRRIFIAALLHHTR
jgi:hypothetical protein